MSNKMLSSESKRDAMLTAPLRKLIPAMALPTIISMLISSIYSLADTFFVSKLGTDATSAVGINASLDQIIMLAGSFLAMGAGSYVSRLLGANNNDKAEQVLVTSSVTAFAFGLVVLIVGKINLVPLVRFLGAIPDIEQYSIDYATYVLYAAPFMAMSFVLNNTLRAEGSATRAMIGMTVGGILNCVLDPIFIFTFDMGVKGASVATAISKLVSFAILLWPYISGRSVVRFALSKIRYSYDIVAEVVKMGSPSLLRMGLSITSAILMNRIAGAQFSTSVLAAISVTNRLLMVLFSACLGLGQGFQPVVGFCWGAKRTDRIVEAYNFTSKLSAIAIALPSAVVFIFAKQLIGSFTTTDETMLEIGMFALRAQCVVMPLHAWNIVVNMLYAGMGRAFGALIMSCTRQGLCFIPLLYTLPRLFGVWGLAAIQAGAEIFTLLISIPLAMSILRQLKQFDITYLVENEEIPL